MLDLACHCGRVRLRLARRPAFLHECNCTLCARTGARWGYFHPSEVEVEGRTSFYCRADKADAAAQIHFCPTCGVTTHFTLTPSAAAKFGDSMLGVNLRLADETALAGLELRWPDGRAWAGEGPFTYLREAEILGAPAAPD